LVDSNTQELESLLAESQESLDAWNRTVIERRDSLNSASRMVSKTEAKIHRLKIELATRKDRTVKFTHTYIYQGMGNGGCKFCTADVMDYASMEDFNKGECHMTYLREENYEY
jgi:hypothetical protein